MSKSAKFVQMFFSLRERDSVINNCRMLPSIIQLKFEHRLLRFHSNPTWMFEHRPPRFHSSPTGMCHRWLASK
jgi:hypothetical protein